MSKNKILTYKNYHATFNVDNNEIEMIKNFNMLGQWQKLNKMQKKKNKIRPNVCQKKV